MPYYEAKEHEPGRLHAVFADPYQAFGNHIHERWDNLPAGLHALLDRPLAESTLKIRVIHGWENGSCQLGELNHSDHEMRSLDDLRHVDERYHQARSAGQPLPHEERSLLESPLDEAIEQAKQAGQTIDGLTRSTPARWPAFEQGLFLYTFFKVYHRLIYGEDDAYRSIRCLTSHGPYEVHEFHLEEGEFAIVTPTGDDQPGATLLVLHESQLEPMIQLLETCRVAA
ncbi:hypothetical protein [Modicisalibacter radicis]|uniref:hypothetical protein n=1 Tax=Halomonas sp. EAR18 TaxID=2518972 RepID=UPI00109C122B|nr:hypothetical protein [Halomonas sp. EAR18]